MFKYLIYTVVSLIGFMSFGQSIKYNLKMPKPQNHYYVVEMELEGFSKKEIEVKMPVWAPGSYLVREFAKNVDMVTAKDENGNALEVKKTSKSTWNVAKGKAKKVTVSYEVYAFELTVRTSFLDLTHGFVSSAGVFMYVDGYKDSNGSLEVFPHESFGVITTALKEKGEGVTKDGSKTFEFDNYDQLVDCPIEIGNQEVFSFTSSGVKHNVAIYGFGNYDIEALKVDMAKVTQGATDVFGENPNKEYTFIIHNVVDGQGGLEHCNSTVLSVNRWTYSGSKYTDFLKLVAHEYFHLWNVKRIRPVELGPFNYDEENYTSLLWVMEGFTSYYEKLILLREGIYTKDQFVSKMFSSLNYIEGSVGARVQPVSHASFDAWIKAYRPNENSSNTTQSYYSSGSVKAMMLDAMIIKKYNGEKCLDHFLQLLYTKYYKGKNRGFSEEEFKSELAGFLGQNMDEFFDKYIDGTEIPDYNAIFSPIGLNVSYTGEAKPTIGISMRDSGGKTIITNVQSGSSAEDAGLSVNDEIIGVNAMRADKSSLDSFFETVQEGTVMSVLFAREDELFSTDLVVKLYEQPKFNYSIPESDVNTKLLNYWLRGK